MDTTAHKNDLFSSVKENIYISEKYGKEAIVQEIPLSSHYNTPISITTYRGYESTFSRLALNTISSKKDDLNQTNYYEFFGGQVLSKLLNTNAISDYEKIRLALSLSVHICEIHDTLPIKIVNPNHLLLNHMFSFRVIDLDSFFYETQQYCSPEILYGHQNYNELKSLFYSLGLVIYRIFYGSENDPKNETGYLNKKINQNISTGIPAIDRLLTKLIADRPDDRPENWIEILSELHSAQLELKNFEVFSTLQLSGDPRIGLSSKMLNSLDIGKGTEKKIVFLEGPSGSGKTSLVMSYLLQFCSPAVDLIPFRYSRRDVGVFGNENPFLGILKERFDRLLVEDLSDDLKMRINNFNKLYEEIIDPNSQTSATVPGLIFNVQNILELISREKYVIIFADDVQWSDSFFREFITHISNNKTINNVLFVMTQRPEITEEDKPIVKVNKALHFTSEVLSKNEINFTLKRYFPFLSQSDHLQLVDNAYRYSKGEVYSFYLFIKERMRLENDLAGNSIFLKEEDRGRANSITSNQINNLSLPVKLVLYVVSLLGASCGEGAIRRLWPLAKILLEDAKKEAIREGYLCEFYYGGVTHYKFCHDRIFEAVKSLKIPKEFLVSRKELVLHLVALRDENSLCSNSVVIARHLSTDYSYLEYELKVDIYRVAAKMCQEKLEYKQALEYHKTVISIINEEKRGNLSLLEEAYTGALSSAFLLNDGETIEGLLCDFYKSKSSDYKKAELSLYLLDHYKFNWKIKKALEVGVKILADMGLVINPKAGKLQVLLAFIPTKLTLIPRIFKLNSKYGNISPGNTLLLSHLLDAAFVESPEMCSLFIFKLVGRNTKEYGQEQLFELAQAGYGFFFTCILKNYGTAENVYLRLHENMESSPSHFIRPFVSLVVESFIARLIRPLKDTLDPLESAVKEALIVGNPRAALYSTFTYGLHSFATSYNVAETYLNILRLKRLLLSYPNMPSLHLVEMIESACSLLIDGETDSRLLYSYTPENQAESDSMTLMAIASFKIYVHMHKDEFSQAINIYENISSFHESIGGSEAEAMNLYYMGVALSAVNHKNKKSFLKKTIRQFKKLTKQAPYNYKHRLLHLEAEYNFNFRPSTAWIDTFLQGINEAVLHGFRGEAAFMNKRLSKILLSEGKTQLAYYTHLEAARLYRLWGANKLTKNVSGFPDYTVKEHLDNSSHVSAEAWINAGFSLASETDRNIILKKYVEMVSTFAQTEITKAVLLLGDKALIISLYQENAGTEETIIPLREIEKYFPKLAIQRALNKNEKSVVSTSNILKDYKDDVYILDNRVTSFLCLPITVGDFTLGALFAANKQTIDVDDSVNFDMLNILSSQVAALIRASSSNEASKNLLIANQGKRKAEEANVEIAHILAGVGHNMRTPISNIKGYAYLIENADEIEKGKGFSRDIITASNHLAGMLDDLVNLGKSELGVLSLNKENVTIKQIILSLEKTVLRKEGVALTFTVPVNMDHLVIELDRSKVEQILINLINNAMLHTDKGNVDLTITKEEKESGILKVCFKVSDTGVGINEHTSAKMFNAFYSKNGSTGIGLTLCRKFAQIMGTDIHYQPNEGIGSCFSFDLMCDISIQPNKFLPDKFTSSKFHEFIDSKKSIRVLLAEDNEMASNLILELLKHPKITIENANNGVKALSLADKSLFDVYIIDIRMPEVGGIEVIESLSQTPNNIGKIICLTAEPLDKEKALNAGADYFLTKPFEPETFFRVIQSIINENDSDNNTDISIEKAMECLGTEELVIIEMKSYKDNYQELQSMLMSKKMPVDLAMILHRLASDAEQIGAFTLSTKSRNLFNLYKDGDTLTNDDDIFDIVRENAKVLKSIELLLNQEPNQNG